MLEVFSGLARDLRTAAAQQYAPYGVGPAQAKLLRQIRKQSRVSQAELARATASDPTLTSRVLATLVSKGWVRRERSEVDRRQYLLELSPAGRRMNDKLERARAGIARRMSAALDQADRAHFARLASKLRVALGASARD